MNRIRKELWIGLVIFPVALLIGRAAEALASPEGVHAAAEYQRMFMEDVLRFNPFTFVGRIWDVLVATFWIMTGPLPDLSDADSVGAFVAHILPWLIRFPIMIFGTIFAVIGSVWENDTLLASILVTLSFILALGIGGGIAVERFESWGLLGVIPATGIIYLVGTLACTVLWGLTWLGLVLFGWITEFAGFCFLCGTPLTLAYFIGVQYAGFRAVHETEKTLASGEHDDDNAGKR